jgi:hypothetical protein
LTEENKQNRKKKLEDNPYRMGSRSSIAAEDIKNFKQNQQLPFEPTSSLSSPSSQQPKEKVKQQEK